MRLHTLASDATKTTTNTISTKSRDQRLKPCPPYYGGYLRRDGRDWASTLPESTSSFRMELGCMVHTIMFCMCGLTYASFAGENVQSTTVRNYFTTKLRGLSTIWQLEFFLVEGYENRIKEYGIDFFRASWCSSSSKDLVKYVFQSYFIPSHKM